MGLETSDGRHPLQEVSQSTELAVPQTEHSLAPTDTNARQGLSITPLPDTYPRTLRVSGSSKIPISTRVIPPIQNYTVDKLTESPSGHRDIIAEPRDAAGIIESIVMPVIRSRSDSSVTIVDVSEVGASTEVVQAATRRGIPAEERPVSTTTLLESSTADHMADVIARRITDDKHRRTEIYGIIRDVSDFLTDGDSQAQSLKIPVLRDTLAAMIGRKVPNMDPTIVKTIRGGGIYGVKEIDEITPTVRSILHEITVITDEDRINATSAAKVPTDTTAQMDTRPSRVIALRVQDPGIGNVTAISSMVTRRMIHMIRAQEEPGVPDVVAVLGAEHLSPEDLQRLGNLGQEQGVRTIFAYGEPTEEHMPHILQRGTLTLMASTNGLTAEGIARIVGPREDTRVTGTTRSNSSSLTEVDDTTEVDSITKAKRFKHRKDVTPTVNTQKTRHRTVTRTDGSDTSEQTTIGQFARIEPGEIQDLRPGEGVVVRRGQTGLEGHSFSLPEHADVGLQLPLREQLRQAFPKAAASAPSEITKPSVEEPLPKWPVSRWREITVRKSAAGQGGNDGDSISTSRMLRDAGLSWETFVTSTGNLRLPDLSKLPRHQRDAVEKLVLRTDGEKLVLRTDEEIELALRDLAYGRIPQGTVVETFKRDRESAAYVAEYRENRATVDPVPVQDGESVQGNIIDSHTSALELEANHAVNTNLTIHELTARVLAIEQRLQIETDPTKRTELGQMHAFFVGKIVEVAQEETGESA